MQVELTKNTAYTNTIYPTNINKTTTTSFNIATLENKAPEEITYNEYKNLNKKDIEKLFPKQELPKEHEKAIALHKKVNISDDEILNEILFEKELNENHSEIEQKALHMIDFIGENSAILNSFESYKNTDQYMTEYNIPFSKEVFTQIYTKMEKPVTYNDQNKITAEELFKVFENNKLGYETRIDFYNYTVNDMEYQNFQEDIAYKEDIKITYEKKINERNTSLESYTKKSTKPYF